ncbi:MAG: hypothetical protein GSR77_02315 [Desulfurococcales archaeon]|nr:hypothetical protein [Desulfurococcales archaeon]
MNRRTAIASTFIIVAVIVSLAAPIQSTAQFYSGQQELVTNIHLPAVESSGKGTIINVTITIIPGGTGKVEVVSNGRVDDTTKYSMMQATVTGALLAGYDWRSFDYKIVFLNTSDVAGPSGSAMTAFAIYSLLSGSPVQEIFANMTMTGAISPVGLYSAVGGIIEKCTAARNLGLAFYYPMANYNPEIEVACPQAIPVSGFMSSMHALTGVSMNASYINLNLPSEFNDGMKNASDMMRNLTVQVLSSVPVENLGPDLLTIYNMTISALNESVEYYNDHPYASASKAFYALYRAYQLYYMYEIATLQSNTGVREYILSESQSLERNLTMLRERLDNIDYNGSVYYIEFLGIAYSRLASAESSLERINVLISINVPEAISELAYVHARVYSILSWIDTAERVKGLWPRLDRNDTRLLATLMGDFSHISTQYSIALANYMIDTYGNTVDAELLRKYVDILQLLLDEGDRYAMQANYVAALGFYREALSQSMNNIFSIIPSSNTTVIEYIYKNYIAEVVSLYDLITLRAISSGIIPGLAPAYMDYALLEAKNGNYETALSLGRAALASSIIWYLYTLAKNPGIETMPRQETPEIFMPTSPGNTPVILVMASLLLAGILVGLLYSARLLRSTIKSVKY